MNRFSVYMILMVFSLCGFNTFAADNEKENEMMEKAEFNLLHSLESDNYGVRTSAAQILGDIKSTKAVIPLMRMLKSSDDEKTRIIAALSLYKIGSSMGMFTVMQSAKFDESARVRKMCENFYKDHYVKDTEGTFNSEVLSDYASKY